MSRQESSSNSPAGPDTESTGNAFETAPAETLSQLVLLGNLKPGFGNYYLLLLREKDEVLSVAAACALLDSNYVPPDILPRLQELAEFQAVRTRTFDYFIANHEHDLANALIRIPARSVGNTVQQALEAACRNDCAALARIEVEKFQQTGILEHLVQAANNAEVVGGWRQGLPLLVKLVLINPQEGRWALRLCRTLADANQFELVVQFCSIAETAGAFPMVSTLYRAFLALAEDTPAVGLKLLDQMNIKQVPRAVESDLCRIKAALFEAAGDFEEANRWYEKQNKLYRTEYFDRDIYMEGVKRKAALEVPELPRDNRSNYFIILGFPRSGTTLLENALASHPAVETFEEIPGWASLQQVVLPMMEKSSVLPLDLAIKARARYYREIDRRKRKNEASIFVDKLPILSADSVFLEKLFPQKKYIFSVRHPYDVVLSCFKQSFNANSAMDNFTTFADSCRIYDFAMEQWFKTFNLDSERVCYIRYDRLVENLQEEVTRALHFLGAEWNNGILQFSQRADERKAKTPSYANVRKGVSIGVQTSWRSYEFLFRKPEARVLDRWAGHFGYEGI